MSKIPINEYTCMGRYVYGKIKTEGPKLTQHDLPTAVMFGYIIYMVDYQKVWCQKVIGK